MTPSSPVWPAWGWLSSVAPLPPSASLGRSPFVGVACGSGVIPSPTSGRVNGGGDDNAAAPTTAVGIAIATLIGHRSTTHPPMILTHSCSHHPNGVVTMTVDVPPPPCPSSKVPTMLIDNGNVGTDKDHRDGDHSSLLHSTAGDVSVSCSGCRRDGWSRVPLGVPSISRRSPPPPTAVEGGAAQRDDGRPAAHVANDEVTSRPRPGPASLLSSTQCPQQGHVTTGAGRAGHARRARGTGVSETLNLDAGLIQGPACVRRSARQATGVFKSPLLPIVGSGENVDGAAHAAAGLRVARQVAGSHRAVSDQDENESSNELETPAVVSATARGVAHCGSAPAPVRVSVAHTPIAPRRQGGSRPTPAAPWA